MSTVATGPRSINSGVDSKGLTGELVIMPVIRPLREDFSNRISELVIPGSGAEFQGADFRMFTYPCVYVFLRDLEPLYVGSSVNGLGRPAQPNHKQALEARKQCNRVLVYFCKFESEAREAERLLISNLRPIFNKQLRNAVIRERLGRRWADRNLP